MDTNVNEITQNYDIIWAKALELAEDKDNFKKWGLFRNTPKRDVINFHVKNMLTLYEMNLYASNTTPAPTIPPIIEKKTETTPPASTEVDEEVDDLNPQPRKPKMRFKIVHKDIKIEPVIIEGNTLDEVKKKAQEFVTMKGWGKEDWKSKRME